MSTRSLSEMFERDHRQTARDLNQFYSVLEKLRFEGKQNLSKNLKHAQEFVSNFKKDFESHMIEEEKILFPFLARHIPKLKPMIGLLNSEHSDFRDSMNKLKSSLSKAQKPAADRAFLIYKINEQFTYLICFLRGHMQVETQVLYRIAEDELRPDEKKQLIECVKKASK